MTIEPLTTEPGYKLGYVVSKEAYYHRVVDQEGVSVGKYADGGGCVWEFQVVNFPNIGIRIDVFDDAFAAYREIAPFFDALQDHPRDLKTIRAILDRLGFADQTVRADPRGIEHCGCGCDVRLCTGGKP